MFTQTQLASKVLLLALMAWPWPILTQTLPTLKSNSSNLEYKKHAWSEKATIDLIQTHEQYKAFKSAGKTGVITPVKSIISVDENTIRVEIAAKEDKIKEVNELLQDLGLLNISSYKALFNGDLPFEQLEQLVKSEDILFVRPAYKPHKFSGNALSQGDASMFTDNIRTNSGHTGSGVKVGAMSDSYDYLGGASTGVLNKELPGVGNTDYSTPVSVLSDYSDISATDEGRALLEIVHDVAPGASLAYHTAFGGISTFANGITNLYNAGCDVIVEDIRYYASPFYMDGLVAQAAETAVSNGTVFVSSAGNQASNSYEGNYNTNGSGITIGSLTYSSTHEFSTGDIYQQLSIPSGQTLTLVFQWDDPFASVTGSTGADVDLDIYLINTTTSTAVASSIDSNTGGDPVEIMQYTNSSGSTETLSVLIGQYSGTAPTKVKYVIFNNSITIDEYATNSATCYGQANGANVLAIGAIDYTDTPEYGTTPPVLQSYSSSGGIAIMFDNMGNSITPVTRAKPDFCGPDGVDNSFFGSDTGDSGSYPNFFGTSASAPHIAGLVALLLEAEPTATPAQIKSSIGATCVDVGSAGFDTDSGFGLVDGESALTTLSSMLLPLEWGQIKASPKTDHVLLEWETITETNTDFFEIEYSLDGKHFEVIGEMWAAGFSTDLRRYQFVDMDAEWGANYYRIRQYDRDGKFTYSPIVHAQLEESISENWQMYPNPVPDKYFQLKLDGKINRDFDLEIYSIGGKLLWSASMEIKNQSEVSVEIPDLRFGLYFLKIIEPNKTTSLPFLKT